MKEKEAIAWNIFDHTHIFENGIVAYHCPICGKFYEQGPYTIEGLGIETGGKYTLCLKEEASCCGKKLPTPVIFYTPEEAQVFLESITKNWHKVIPTKSSMLISAHVRNDGGLYH